MCSNLELLISIQLERIRLFCSAFIFSQRKTQTKLNISKQVNKCHLFYNKFRPTLILVVIDVKVSQYNLLGIKFLWWICVLLSKLQYSPNLFVENNITPLAANSRCQCRLNLLLLVIDITYKNTLSTKQHSRWDYEYDIWK